MIKDKAFWLGFLIGCGWGIAARLMFQLIF